MNATTYNKILTVYNGLKLSKKRVTKNDVLLQSLFNAGGTFDTLDIDLFFKIKKQPQKYFLTSKI
jgi:hypothetical protein